jgi:hypothetical protein
MRRGHTIRAQITYIGIDEPFTRFDPVERALRRAKEIR